MRRNYLIVVIFTFLSVILVGHQCCSAELARVSAQSFSSGGDYIHGWYWLRDPSFDNVAEWVFAGIPLGDEELVLDLEVLATDRVDGPSGVDARFFISFGIPPWGDRGGLIVGTQEVFLPNVSPPGDPVGYTCKGQVRIPRDHMENASVLWIRAHRSYIPGQPGTAEHLGRQRRPVSEPPPSLLHVAFRKESVVLCIDEVHEQYTEEMPYFSDELPCFTASNFYSGGTYIHGWYWLRDPSFENVAEWVFEGIPLGEEDLILNLEVLATDRVDGPPGVDARFFLSFGIPPWDDYGGLIVGTKEVTLPNVSPPGDPVGYTCKGQVRIPRDHMENASVLWIRAHRSYIPGQPGVLEHIERHRGVASEPPPSLLHVAFRKESVVLCIDEVHEQYTEDIVIDRDADWRWEAKNVDVGTIGGTLGTHRADGTLNTEDWYRFTVQVGQIIDLSLAMPHNAQFSIALYPPDSTSSVGSSTLSGNIRTLQYVAGTTGDWFVRVSRTRGEGEYLLGIELLDQNDAGSGQDAGNYRWDALSLVPGVWSGFLKVADTEDWYRFPVHAGQLIDLSLTMPHNAQFSIALFPPDAPSSVGSSTLYGNIRTLQYVAGTTGDWFVRVSRTSGEGEYTLSISTTR